MRNLLITKLFFPAISATTRYNFWPHFKQLLKNQYLTQKELKELQWKKLKAMMEHAYSNVPFYHEKFKDAGIKPSQIKNEKDLLKIPVTTRQEVIENFPKKILSKGIKEDECRFLETSGSVGNKLYAYMDFDCYNKKYAHLLRAFYYTGWKFGEKYAQMSPAGCIHNSMCLYRLGKAQLLKEFFHLVLSKKVGKSDSHVFIQEGIVYPFIHRRLLLGPFDSQNIGPGYEQGMDYYKKLAAYSPYLFKAYSNYIYLLARFVEEQGLARPNIKSILMAMGPSTKRMRNLIGSVFGCRVFDSYGSRECGIMATTCEEGNYHVDVESVHTEFVKEGEQVTGERAKIIVTDLDNFAMPLIRYDIGDVGVGSDEKCSCGRGLPLMSSAESRSSNMITSQKGWLTESMVLDFFAMTLGLSHFQVVQTKRKELVVRLQKICFEPEIRSFFAESLGNGFKIKFETAELRPEMSGKTRFVKALGT